MLIKKYYFIKFTFIKKYVDERSKKIISLLLAERKMLINLKKKSISSERQIYEIMSLNIGMHFFYFKLKFDHTV